MLTTECAMPFDNPAKNELALAHEQQIAALTDPWLTDKKRVRRFGEAAGFNEKETKKAIKNLAYSSAAKAVWFEARPEKSLFANLPSCECPVRENEYSPGKHPDIPKVRGISDWRPTRADLKAFARVQQEARHAL